MSCADGTCHLACNLCIFEFFELVEEILVSKFLSEEFDLFSFKQHLLLYMILNICLAIDLLLQIAENLSTLLECLCNVDILLSTFDTLDSLLLLDLRATDFETLSLNELLFLEMDDGCLLLASLKQFLELLRIHEAKQSNVAFIKFLFFI